MKSIYDFADPYFKTSREGIFGANLAIAVANAIGEGAIDVSMPRATFKNFTLIYDMVLPHDWDRKSFRGLTIHIVEELGITQPEKE